jgi:hypothetical protein
MKAVVEDATGRLLSLGTVVTEKLPPGVVVLTVAEPAQGQMWDATQRAFVPRPVKVLVDRLDDLAANDDFRAVWQTLNLTQRAAMRRALIWVLGGRRFRSAGERPEVDG